MKTFNSKLRNRYESSTTLQYHRFVTHLSAYKLSAQSDHPVVEAITAQATHDNITGGPLDITEQNYMCCLYDNKPWIGLMENISDEHGDYYINFMHPDGSAKLFHWPRD